jgi:hypothetical protein
MRQVQRRSDLLQRLVGEPRCMGDNRRQQQSSGYRKGETKLNASSRFSGR